jgi:hypothetical protein
VSLRRKTFGAAALAALALAGCRSGEPERGSCADASELAASGRIAGELFGDVDGNRTLDRVALRTNEARPPACRHVLVVEIRDSPVAAVVEPLPWPGTDPRLLLLVEVDGRAGLEPVIALSPPAVYRPGAVFTFWNGELERMRLQGRRPADLFPFADEFPAGVDCVGGPGTIVVTSGSLADAGRDDRHWAVTRSRYRAAGTRFVLVRSEEFRVEVGPEVKQRWPELRGDPFLSCEERIPP